MIESFTIQDIRIFKERLFLLLKDEPVFCLLDSCDYYNSKDLNKHPYYHDYDFVCCFGVQKILKCDAGNAIQKFQEFQNENKGEWMFGYFGYDLKNEIEKLKSENPDETGFDDLFFFVPETVAILKGNELRIYGNSVKLKDVFSDAPVFYSENPIISNKISFKERVSKNSYLEIVEKLRQHIIEGDVYEVSFCQEFFAENLTINPFDVYQSLGKISPQPFSSFVRIEDKYIIGASMERYLKKMGNKLVSQPIKGTIRRGNDAVEDEKLKDILLNDEKERAENVMIVDLVRNDLSRVCKAGTVNVEELFGIYDFPGVFQMISTVTGELLPEKNGLDAIKASFPMGSMTGAPKIMAMQIIEQYENTKRGVYSGALGYFAPNGDFDFNVVIRTLLYNASKRYLSLHVGSAITFDSVPEKEYEECLVKIKTVLKALEN